MLKRSGNRYAPSVIELQMTRLDIKRGLKLFNRSMWLLFAGTALLGLIL